MNEQCPKFRSVKHGSPCPLCQGTHKCSVGDDGVLMCGRVSGEVPGFVRLGPAKKDPQFTLYRREGDPVLKERDRQWREAHPHHEGNGQSEKPMDWTAMAEEFRKALTPARRDELAADLGVLSRDFALLAVGWQACEKCWTFPERDAAGQVIGINRRWKGGEKKLILGGHRGLYIPNGWRSMNGPILLPEGASNVLALRAMGLCGIGRPNNTAGGELLAGLLRGVKDREVIVVGDFDPKWQTGLWPGLEGARKTAAALSQELGRLVPWCLPPEGKKDVRSWFNGLNVDLTCQDTMEDAGVRLLGTLNTHKQGQFDPEATNGDVPAEGGAVELATAADLIRVNATIRWLWPQWLPLGVLTLLGSDAGVGKTRFCADLLRRIYHGLPWPDGTPATLPAGSGALWVAADNQHPELGTLPGAFGFPPEALALNATRANPFGGTMLDSPEDLRLFERHVERSGVRLVFIDTCLNATERSANKPEDAAAFFKPLQEIAARRQVGMVVLTHLNAGGTPLGRRVVAQCRVAMQLERPDPEGQPHRRKLHVTKSNSLYPPPLGVTMGATGNQYDDRPPCPPEEGDKDPPRLAEAVQLLRNCLGTGQGMALYKVRQAAEDKGFTAGTLYRAKTRLGVEEYTRKGKKWWRVAATDEEE
jgi:hypothetical protein